MPFSNHAGTVVLTGPHSINYNIKVKPSYMFCTASRWMPQIGNPPSLAATANFMAVQARKSHRKRHRAHLFARYGNGRDDEVCLGI